MMAFEFRELDLRDAYLIYNFHIEDKRGRFVKCFEEQAYKKAGISFSLSESFISISQKNVIRGLHFQTKNPQAKLVSVIQGRIFDVILDLRRDSVTFGEWRGVELSAEKANALYIPRGFAHGFASLADNSIVLYQCDGIYDAETDTGIRFDDDDIAVKWPINLSQGIYSSRDLGLMSFEEFKINYKGLDIK